MKSSGNSDKDLRGLSMRESYGRIYDWHTRNRELILDKLPRRKKRDPYVICYQKLLQALPSPEEATREDVTFVCREVIAGLMEWAYNEKDEKGVKISTYAHYVLGTFFDGFNGKEATLLSRKSKLYNDYSMGRCLASIRIRPKSAVINGYLEELLRASSSDNIKNIMQLLLKESKDNVKDVVNAAIKKIKENEYDGSKWSTLAFSISTSFNKHDEVSGIFEELVKREPENAAHYNNLGVNYLQRKLYGSALKSFASAYALDFRFRGRKKAVELPAWKNLSSLCSFIDKLKIDVHPKQP